MKDLVINENFKELIPPLSAEEFSQLEFNLIQDGCREPLVVWEGRDILIDGHNRYQICQANGIEFDTVELEFDNEREAEIWIIRNQFGRRNITNFVRAELALKLKPKIAAKAKEKQISEGKNLGGNSTLCQTSDEGSIDTKKELASIAGVSHDTINRVERILDSADDDTKEKLRSGEISVNKAFNDVSGKPHVSNNSGNNEWYTPHKYVDACRSAMGCIDTDPATCKFANQYIGAAVAFTKEDEGQNQQWGGNVWLNPPYSQPDISEFSDAVVREWNSGRVESMCVLVNNATETAWFQSMLSDATAVCFVRGRIKYLNQEGVPANSPLQGQAILYFGDKQSSFRKHLGAFGVVICNG